ncbi:heat shock protein Hsp90 [Thalassiosira pseudonana CCMP1335]|uniref:Heat shock protein Hsp90 n=1 Tax=Thalassiosira pseudonana TaxID=35128 RepID=B8C311_THAPS|nr:heat shock protein Hsp90 [Thalassiosira pseudonana CCMP1335]EED92477.1 heat shock protein Hsp90 [Thalassiosira pseudonana CCMP1335]
MLDIVVNSLYTNKDVFLRELISNASDALDKIRFLSVTKPEMLGDTPDLEMKIEYDPDQRTLTIRDTGVGMTKEDLIANLGTVARSGTTNFVKALGEGAADVSMIGMFGVGFYSTFLVADKVTVASKNNDDDVQHIWESLNGEASFHVGPDPRGNTLGRGTEITLHLKEDADEYLGPRKLKEMVRHYSEFVTHPVYLREIKKIKVPVEREEEDEDEFDAEDIEGEESKEEKAPEMEEVTTFEYEHINTDPAIWARDKEEITDEEYQEFWKVVSKGDSSGDAEEWVHFNAEGNINFKSILYLPSEVPFALQQGRPDEVRPGLRLYVRKVLISDEFDLMPRYLGFIKGVVDSDDLPLNVNRETLQESKIIKIIKKKLVRKTIDLIQAELDADGNVIFKEDKPKAVHPYITWYKKFGLSLKMGCLDDSANKDKLQKLLRFKSSKTEGDDDYVSLQEYVDRMPEWQKEIYVFPGESMKQLKESSFMDAFYDRDVEVLFLTDSIDEYYVQQVREFGGKKYRDITKEGVKFSDEDEDLAKRRNKVYTDKFKPLTKYLKKLFGGDVTKVTISKRLGKAPAIVSASEWGNSANMDRIMRAQAFAHGVAPGENMMPTGNLELNPRHPFVIKLLESLPEDEDAEVPSSVKDSAWILFDTATMSGGFPIRDPKKYAARMTRVLKSNLEVDSLTLADEIDPPEEFDMPDMADFDMADLEDLDM